jgi:hypothetical protein
VVAIQIDVPNEIRDALVLEAKRRNMSLQDYVEAVLRRDVQGTRKLRALDLSGDTRTVPITLPRL